MIKSYKDSDAELIFGSHPVRGFSTSLQRQAQRKLRILDKAVSLADLRAPLGNHLERLSGNRAGQYSIRINDQW